MFYPFEIKREESQSGSKGQSQGNAGHDDLHYRLHVINVKYGYIFLGISVAYAAFLFFYKRFSGGRLDRVKLIRKRNLASFFWLSMIFWVLAVGVASVWNVDMRTLLFVFAKRIGRISYALLPLDIFLATRPIIGLHYLELLDLHKWMSRLIILCAIIHSVVYLVLWTIEGALYKALKLLNFWGVISAVLLVVLLVISVKYFRRKFYNSFYIIHNIAFLAFTFLIYFHARPGVLYLSISSVALLANQFFQKLFRTLDVANIEILTEEDSDLVFVSIKHSKLKPWPPASHIRISAPRMHFSYWFLPSHPYTIASLYEEQGSMDLIMKKTKFQLKPQTSYSLIGPYSSFPDKFIDPNISYTIICGGSGISFGLPMFRVISRMTKPPKFIWCVRQIEDVHVLHRIGYNDTMDIYVTRGSRTRDSNSNTPSDPDAEFLLVDEEDDAIEMSNLDIQDSDDKSAPEILSSNTSQFNIFKGRPDVSVVVSNVEEYENSRVIVCGPSTLVNDVQNFCESRNIAYYADIYEM